MELTAQHLLWLKPVTAPKLPATALPAAVEYRTPHGCGCFPVAAALADAVLQAPELAALGGLASLKLFQTEAGGWQAIFSGRAAGEPVVWDVQGETVRQVLRQNGFSAELLAQLDAAAATVSPAGDAPPWAE